MKWNQPPDLVDGFDVVSWRDIRGSMELAVADDWICTDGSAIGKIKWWGSYRAWKYYSPAPVDPPEVKPIGFRIYWYDYLPGPLFPRPGNLKKIEFCDKYTEKWIGAVSRWNYARYYEHEFEYECELGEPWFQSKGERYFLMIQAIYEKENPQFPWGWLNSSNHWNAAAVLWTGTRWLKLSWPNGHRLQGNPMDMSFELWKTDVTPTPTPTMTPTPRPTPTPTATPTPQPGSKWVQPVNATDGFDIISWTGVKSVVDIRGADDWLCTNGKPIKHIRWWGSYPGWKNKSSSPVDSPTTKPVAFKLGWYEYNDGGAVAIPGKLFAEETCTEFSEIWSRSIPLWNNTASYEHEFMYDCNIKVPWEQTEGTRYFLVIQAVFDVVEPKYKWGWANSSVQWNSRALFWNGSIWKRLQWPDEHRLEGEPMDFAFELWTEVPPAPTPTPVAKADFYATPTLTMIKRPVRFMDTSTGELISWSWDLGDSKTSDLRNPLHFYDTPGTYTITLEVSGPFGSDSKTREDYVVIMPYPSEQDLVDYLLGIKEIPVGDVNRDGWIDMADLISLMGK